jgi:hypothetical protein
MLAAASCSVIRNDPRKRRDSEKFETIHTHFSFLFLWWEIDLKNFFECQRRRYARHHLKINDLCVFLKKDAVGGKDVVCEAFSFHRPNAKLSYPEHGLNFWVSVDRVGDGREKVTRGG